MRRLGVPIIVLTVALLLAGCGDGGANKGGMPVPAGDDSSASTTGTPTKSGEKPTTKPTEPAKTTAPSSGARVIVVPGSFASNPAVQALVNKYPLYYQALVQRNSNIIKTSFPAFFYADTAVNIDAAKTSGWVMRPPGSVVVVGVVPQPYGVVRVDTCRSQTMQWWNPKARKWVVLAPHGTAEAIDMVRTGLGWVMYRMVRPLPKGINCSRVHYPA